MWEQKRQILSIKDRVQSKLKDASEIIERIDGSCIFTVKS
jgi:hypothetical protein